MSSNAAIATIHLDGTTRPFLELGVGQGVNRPPPEGESRDFPRKSGEPPGTRTPNPQIKSLLLYQLS